MNKTAISIQVHYSLKKKIFHMQQEISDYICSVLLTNEGNIDYIRQEMKVKEKTLLKWSCLRGK